MLKQYEMFNRFIWSFVRHSIYLQSILVALVLLIVLGGLAISYYEGLTLSESMYFAFVTGLTIGYGDITPKTTEGRIVSVAIGLVGMLVTGLVIAIATRTLKEVADQHHQEGQR